MTTTKKQGAGRPKSEEKKEQILKAASTLFLECGFASTSMDLVANRAGVSKQTVYSHFENKDRLYVAVIEGKCSQYCFDEDNLQLNPEDLETSLKHLGHQFIKLLSDPEVIATYKALIGDIGNNPHIAELFYSAGSRRGRKILADYFVLQERYPIPQDVAEKVSILFFSTLKGEFHIRNLLGLTSEYPPHYFKQHVNQVVEWILLCLAHESNKLSKQ
ncbi:TetR/AcrR family transcriptional regulator [Alteromonas sp. a30]|uniref:TetR/AcrR family transcriptional regulator n=1 Tax=Alteromonas sp. a30 TaxID=2730917 RepID=UPI0022828346|nr:TetR/AcrR family transcriptional regulator [Alteromonas sp. a30]MCY7294621.1 TetR/AcrR family transcriptional regulator [Alteromonas sp. a30]